VVFEQQYPLFQDDSVGQLPIREKLLLSPVPQEFRFVLGFLSRFDYFEGPGLVGIEQETKDRLRLLAMVAKVFSPGR
jgi:hypothetical protein